MDIYGYPSFPCNQPPETLANQMLAQQALAMPCNRDIPEPHVMPAPTGAPWNMQGMSWGSTSPPQLVQFTGRLPPMETNMPAVIHCKRKSLDVEPVIPAKQLITEERMAAHMNRLHISSQYTAHSQAAEEVMDIAMDPIPVSEKLKGHTIVLSDELKKLQEEPLLPAALIERLEKPHMSLVVWKPRANILEQLKEEDSNSEEDNDSQSRTGVLVVPHPTEEDVEM